MDSASALFFNLILNIMKKEAIENISEKSGNRFNAVKQLKIKSLRPDQTNQISGVSWKTKNAFLMLFKMESRGQKA